MKQAIELTEQLIKLAEAKDKEFLKLIEKINTHPIYGASKRPIPNGDDAIVYHLKVLLELLQQEDKRLENIIAPNDHKPIYETPPWAFGRNQYFTD